LCGETCGLNQHLFKVTSDVYDKWFYYLWTAHHLAVLLQSLLISNNNGAHQREELAKAEVLIPCEEDYTSFNSIMQPIFELMISNRIESRKLAHLGMNYYQS
jgi:type I restriction enzyme S subunit